MTDIKSGNMPNAPLVNTLFQVVTLPIPNLDTFIKDIKITLSENGYPVPKDKKYSKITFHGEDSEPVIEKEQKWLFFNLEQTESITLTENLFVFQTSAYHTFEDCTDKIIKILNLISEIVKYKGIYRIGLRYSNFITSSQTYDVQKITKYLTAGIAGFAFPDIEKEEESLSCLSENVCKTHHGTMIVRCMIEGASKFLPQDIVADGLYYEKFEKEGAIEPFTYLLDIDHFQINDRPIEFDITSVCSTFKNLHDSIEIAFRKTTTDTAQKEWYQE